MKRISAHLLTGSTALLLLLLAGCGRSASFEEPPRERHRLVMDFFRSMQENRPQEAVQQGKKLIRQDAANQYLWELIYVQQYNAAILEAQKAVNEGRFSEAETILSRAAAEVPVNRALLAERQKIRRLKSLQTALKEMENAGNSDAMQKALDRTSSLAGNRPPAKMTQYFARYRKQLQLRRQKEAELARQAAAKKAAGSGKPAAGAKTTADSGQPAVRP